MHEEALRVIARAVRLANRDAHVPGESGEQQRALDLRARDGGRVGERVQPAAANRQRERIAALLLDFGSHGAQRLSDPPHGPAAQRRVTREGRGERLAGEDSEHEPGGCAGIATVEAGCGMRDRKSTRLNSSHGYISYAVFCLKKKKKKRRMNLRETKSEIA